MQGCTARTGAKANVVGEGGRVRETRPSEGLKLEGKGKWKRKLGGQESEDDAEVRWFQGVCKREVGQADADQESFPCRQSRYCSTA